MIVIPQKCPNCSLSFIVKTPYGVWKCPSCGYTTNKKIQEKVPDSKPNIKEIPKKTGILYVTKTTFIKDGKIVVSNPSKRKNKPPRKKVKTPAIIQKKTHPTGEEIQRKPLTMGKKTNNQKNLDKEMLEKKERETAEKIMQILMSTGKITSTPSSSLKTIDINDIKSNLYLDDLLNKQTSRDLNQIVDKLENILGKGSHPMWVRATILLKKTNTSQARKIIESLKNHPDMDVRRIARD